METDTAIKHIQKTILQGTGLIYIGKTYSSKNGRFFSSKSKRLLKSRNVQNAEREAVRQFELQKTITTLRPTKHVHFLFSFGDRRRRDLPNMVQGLMDAMVKAGVYKDDNYNHIIPHHYIPLDGKVPFVLIMWEFSISKILNTINYIYENSKVYK